MSKFRGKRILLIAPVYYGYEDQIRKCLIEFGAIVSFAENKPFANDPANKGTPWYAKFLCDKNKYITKTLLPVANQPYDICLFVDLFSFHPDIIRNLKKQNPNIRCVLYLWDNIKGYKWENFFKYFDKVLSFDPVEANDFKLNYLPNFFPPQTDEPIEPVFDVCSIGSLQIHRLKIFEKEVKKFKELKKPYFIYLYLPPLQTKLVYNPIMFAFTFFFKKRFKGYRSIYNLFYRKEHHDLVKHISLPLNESIRVMSQSRCIIDLPYPAQTGSTQRVINALGLGKKVITTNQSVLKDSFYRPDYIKLISQSDFKIDWDWLYAKPESPIDMSASRLDNWVQTVLS
jgi:hypothetical protein